MKATDLLSPIAKPLAREADTLLDLHEALEIQPHPGRCIRCYFQLLAAASNQVEPRLTPLRRWLEQHIEIAACAEGSAEALEHFPLDLGTSHTLEECCQRSMATVILDRTYAGSPNLALEFRFRAQRAA